MKQTRNIEMEGRKLTVKFSHGRGVHPRLTLWRQTLECRIFEGTLLLALGVAYRRPSEPFNEREGRKKAFERAIERWNEDVQHKLLQSFYNPPKREPAPKKTGLKFDYAQVSDNLARYES